MPVVAWLQENYAGVLMLLSALVAVGEAITRLTPTKTDDGFVSRVGGVIDKVLDLAKVPNIRKKLE